MRVLISGGGTGGHVNPALAIAGIIKKKNPDAVIEFIGTERGLETTLVPREGYKLHFVKVRGFKRKLCRENIEALKEAVTSVFEAKKIIRSFGPDIVIGTGGYVCWPVLKAASSMKIPTVIHEQNAVAGVTNKVLSGCVDKVMISFEASRECFKHKEKLVFTGNPIKLEMLGADREAVRRELGLSDKTPLILSFGGSLGARKVNDMCYELIENFSEKSDVMHIHATGKSGFAFAKKHFLERGYTEKDDGSLRLGNVTVREYIYNMPSLVAAADVVISRAGAMTVSELAAMKKAAILIPSPNVTNNHQYKNAKVLADANGAVLIEEKDISGKLLTDTVRELCTNAEKRHSLEKNIAEFAVTDSLERIYGVIEDTLKKSGK